MKDHKQQRCKMIMLHVGVTVMVALCCGWKFYLNFSNVFFYTKLKAFSTQFIMLLHNVTVKFLLKHLLHTLIYSCEINVHYYALLVHIYVMK